MHYSECDVPVLGIPGTVNLSYFWWYRKKLLTEKSLGTGIGRFGTGTYFRRQNLGFFKIYNGYRYRLGTGTGIPGSFYFFRWYRNRYRKKSWNRKICSIDRKSVLSIENLFYR